MFRWIYSLTETFLGGGIPEGGDCFGEWASENIVIWALRFLLAWHEPDGKWDCNNIRLDEQDQKANTAELEVAAIRKPEGFKWVK